MKWMQTISGALEEHIKDLIISGEILKPQEYIRKLVIKDKKEHDRKANKLKVQAKKKV